MVKVRGYHTRNSNKDRDFDNVIKLSNQLTLNEQKRDYLG